MRAKDLIKILQDTYAPDEEVITPFIKINPKPMPDGTDYTFRIVMISDMGTVHEKHKEWKYNNALEAATAYNAFEDHGFACCGRTIWLYEPDGTVHHKTFLTRGVDPVTRERLGYNSPVPS